MAVVLITSARSREAYEQLDREVGSTLPQSKLGRPFATFGIEAEPPELTETLNIERA